MSVEATQTQHGCLIFLHISRIIGQFTSLINVVAKDTVNLYKMAEKSRNSFFGIQDTGLMGSERIHVPDGTTWHLRDEGSPERKPKH